MFALQHLHHVVVVFFQPQGAVRFDVADRGHLEFERPEALGEGDLLVAREMLVGKDQQRVLEPGGVERAPSGVVQLRGPLMPRTTAPKLASTGSISRVRACRASRLKSVSLKFSPLRAD